MNLTILLTLLAAMVILNRAKRGQLLLIVVLLGTFFTSNLPAPAVTLAALGAQDSAITQQQQEQEEGLKLTPGGGQYSGLEHVDKPSGKALSDADIQQKISEIRRDITVNSASGSVILSGTVEDKETAQQLVEQVKAIPGVQEVTFELGLQNPA